MQVAMIFESTGRQWEEGGGEHRDTTRIGKESSAHALGEFVQQLERDVGDHGLQRKLRRFLMRKSTRHKASAYDEMNCRSRLRSAHKGAAAAMVLAAHGI